MATLLIQSPIQMLQGTRAVIVSGSRRNWMSMPSGVQLLMVLRALSLSMTLMVAVVLQPTNILTWTELRHRQALHQGQMITARCSATGSFRSGMVRHGRIQPQLYFQVKHLLYLRQMQRLRIFQIRLKVEIPRNTQYGSRRYMLIQNSLRRHTSIGTRMTEQTLLLRKTMQRSMKASIFLLLRHVKDTSSLDGQE